MKTGLYGNPCLSKPPAGCLFLAEGCLPPHSCEGLLLRKQPLKSEESVAINDPFRGNPFFRGKIKFGARGFSDRQFNLDLHYLLEIQSL